MKLLLLRHGEASFDAKHDFDRELTRQGRSVIRSRARQIIDSGIAVEKTIVSPYIRTTQTADLIESLTGIEQRIVDDRLMPDEPLADATAAITGAAEEDNGSLLVITHQPLISALVRFLTGNHQAMAPGDMVLIHTPAIAAGFGEIECVF